MFPRPPHFGLNQFSYFASVRHSRDLRRASASDAFQFRGDVDKEFRYRLIDFIKIDKHSFRLEKFHFMPFSLNLVEPGAGIILIFLLA